LCRRFGGREETLRLVDSQGLPVNDAVMPAAV
jgi:hypothetical protein